MSQCRLSPQEFIKKTFTPQIAVICSPLVEKCCEKNNLSFIELLQPFSKLGNDVYYKDPSGTTIPVRSLKLSFLDVNKRPPQTTVARKLLNSSVSDLTESKVEIFSVGDYQLEVAVSTPWFEAWRDAFLQVQYPSDHEYTKHFLCCVLVVSSAEVNPIESVVHLTQSLNQMQNNAPGKLPKWFSSNILKYYVVIHDNIEGNMEVANETYASLKTSYGESNCFLLRMNSRPPGSSNGEHLPDPWSQFINSNIDSKDFAQSPESSPHPTRTMANQENNADKTNINYHPLSPEAEELVLTNISNTKDGSSVSTRSKLHGHCLSTEDLEQIKAMIYEFSQSCLMPYIERQIQILNDVISNKKGVSRSLFSATKRWFNPNKPGASSVAMNNLIYAPDSPELQVRRLGDLYFMFGQYSLAFQAYHLAKRDYNTDQAWLYYAGALEMASLAAFMSNEANRKTCDYMEESITTYLNTCKMPQFATRATLLSLECLKSRNMYGEAAHQLIRMTSEESDLRSALFLEQAAYCFLRSRMVRKYAFHMVLAGHRFSKAAQKKHSLRSYKQAHQIYENSGWDLAEDHIHYTIGRQAHNLHLFDEAVLSFGKLFKGDSKQSAQQQGIFLKEYLTILENKLKNEESSCVPSLILPELDDNGIKILMGPTRPLSTPGKVPAVGVNFSDDDDSESAKKWIKLEEILVQEAQNSLSVIFKPLITLYSMNNLSLNKPLAIVNEPIQVCIRLVNSLQIVLPMKDICLLWEFQNNSIVISNEQIDNNSERYVKTHIIKSMLIQPNSKDDLILTLTPLVTGFLTLKGICYTLTSSATPSDGIFIKGKQLFKEDAVIKNGRNILTIEVVPLAPCLQVSFSEMNLEFLCDEMQKITVDFSNSGTLPLHKLYMASSVPHLITNGDLNSLPTKVPSTKITAAVRDKLIRDTHIIPVPLPNNRLDPGQTTNISLYIKSPHQAGLCSIDLLIYYESMDSTVRPKYRLVRHKWNLSVQDSINIEISTQSSYNSCNVEESALVLKATNLNKIHSSTLTEISLLNVGMFSKLWKLSENIVTPKYINLSSQESAHILLKAKRNFENKTNYSNIILNSERNIRPNINNAYIVFAKKTEYCQISIFDELADIKWKEYDSGILLIQWQALVMDTNSKRVVNGQTEIFIDPVEYNPVIPDIDEFTSTDPANLLEISINKEKNIEMLPSLQNKVTYNLIYPPVVQHDFTKDKFCVVPIKLFIHSIENCFTLKVVINTLEPISQQASRADFSPQASTNFSWLGTCNAVKKLKPYSSDSLKLKIIVSRPGTFDLGGKIQVFCSKDCDEEQIPILQTYQVQSALIVVDSDN